MQPTYLVATSSGPTPFRLINWHAVPTNVGISVAKNSTTAWSLEYCVDDPSGSFPNPMLGSSAPTIFSTTAGSSTAVYAAFTTPVAAVRLNITSLSSAGARVVATVLQAGIG